MSQERVLAVQLETLLREASGFKARLATVSAENTRLTKENTRLADELAAQTAETERVRTGLQTKLRRLDARIVSLREGKDKAETSLAERSEQLVTANAELFLAVII